MKLIVGLGNPGSEYANTRHNIGWRIVDSFVATEGMIFKSKKKFLSSIAEKNLANDKILVIKPETYMNLSGIAVGKVLSNNNIAMEDLLVVVDDMDLDLGTIRFRKSGGSGGHNGLKSIISSLDNLNTFARLRVGVGKDKRIPAENYVLGRFKKSEELEVDKIISVAIEAIDCWLNKGIDATMNKYN